jgi:hypothetical protein
MKRRDVIASTALAAAAAIVPSRAQAQSADHDVIGSWIGTVVATNPPLGEFNDLISFHTDGVVTESRRYLVKPTPLGDLLETTGHGAWTRTGARSVEAFFRFMITDASTGQSLGTDNVRLAVALAKDGQSLAGTFVSQIKDTADNVVFQASGDYSATRITV